jgi:hypothetical protein
LAPRKYIERDKWGIRTDVLLLLTEHLEDTVTDITIGELDIVLGVTVILHQGQEVIIGDVQLERGLLVMGLWKWKGGAEG